MRKKKKDLFSRAPVTKLCAVEGCGRKVRSRGFCAVDYQKFRLLERTNGLPADWEEGG